MAHLCKSICLSFGDFSLSPVLLHPRCHLMVGFLQQTGLSIVLLKKRLARVSSADFWTKHRGPLSTHNLLKETNVSATNISDPPTPICNFSYPLVNLQFKNMKWKILKINNSCFFKLHTILSDEILHRPALSAQVVNYPFVQLILAVYPTHSSV